MKPTTKIDVTTNEDGDGFDVGIFEVEDDGELTCLATHFTSPGQSVADAAEEAVVWLEACAAEARRQFEAAGILKPKVAGALSGETWAEAAKRLKERLELAEKQLRNRDVANNALHNALGTWIGTGASAHTDTTHKVTHRFRGSDTGRQITVEYTVETEK